MNCVSVQQAIDLPDAHRRLLTVIAVDAPALHEHIDVALLYARIGWSIVCEPGDHVAGTLIRELGAVAALNLVLSGKTVREIAPAIPALINTDGPLSPQRLASALRRWRDRLTTEAVFTAAERAHQAGLRLSIPEDAHWPRAFEALGDHAPLTLWTRGNASILNSAGLAVVGARACTSYGTAITADLVEHASQLGFTIVSGGAYGIDAVAHRTALVVGTPTVAFLAGGADRPYPRAHAQLLERITEQGVVCSEVPPGTAPTRWRFLQRNRNIAALANATLVTEAGGRSGSLNTAGHAASMGRPLGAVPGPITSPASAGCHRLLREYGAALIGHRDDLRELLGISDDLTLFAPATADAAPPASDTAASARQPSIHQRLLDALPLRGVRSTEEVARVAGVNVGVARRTLAELELLGSVARRETPGEGGSGWALCRRE